MKLKLTLLLATVSLVFAHCKKEKGDNFIFITPHHFAGLWQTWRQVSHDYTVVNDVAHGESIFGRFSESIVFKLDMTFTPLRISREGEVTLNTSEEGTFEYDMADRKLTLQNDSKREFEVVKFNIREMWLDDGEYIYKLFKQ